MHLTVFELHTELMARLLLARLCDALIKKHY